MKKISLLFVFAFSLTISFAQGNSPSTIGIKRGPCFQKSLDRIGKKYVDWECDQTGKVVDCNEKLESDPGSNMVFSRSNGKPFTGDCETCHNNGLREHVVHFVNGKVDGIDSTYYKSGCPQVVRSHIQGVENGTWTYFNDTSGLIAWQLTYQNGEKHGQAIYYQQHKVGTASVKVIVRGAEETITYPTYDNDTLKIEQYQYGRLHGTKKEYWPGSKIKKEVEYLNGTMNGKFIQYDTKGKVMEELRYVAGKKDGNQKYYYNDGSLLRTENWKLGVKDGEFKTFYIQGFIQTLETYKKGQKNGRFIENYPDNKIKREAIYKNDVLVEEHEYDKYGNEIRNAGENALNQKDEDEDVPVSKSKEKKPKKEKPVKEKPTKEKKSKE